MNQIKSFVHKHPVRVAAFVSSFVALLVSAFFPNVPIESAVIFALSALGLGEYAQRVEDHKTEDALLAPAPKKNAARKAAKKAK